MSIDLNNYARQISPLLVIRHIDDTLARLEKDATVALAGSVPVGRRDLDATFRKNLMRWKSEIFSGVGSLLAQADFVSVVGDIFHSAMRVYLWEQEEASRGRLLAGVAQFLAGGGGMSPESHRLHERLSSISWSPETKQEWTRRLVAGDHRWIASQLGMEAGDVPIWFYSHLEDLLGQMTQRREALERLASSSSPGPQRPYESAMMRALGAFQVFAMSHGLGNEFLDFGSTESYPTSLPRKPKAEVRVRDEGSPILLPWETLMTLSLGDVSVDLLRTINTEKAFEERKYGEARRPRRDWEVQLSERLRIWTDDFNFRHWYEVVAEGEGFSQTLEIHVAGNSWDGHLYDYSSAEFPLGSEMTITLRPREGYRQDGVVILKSPSMIETPRSVPSADG